MSEQTEYRCRKCGRFLFASDAEYGRVRIICRNRPLGRSCGEEQTVYLGGKRRTVARQPAPAEERCEAVLVGA